MEEKLLIDIYLTAKDYRDFSRFNQFILTKNWRRLLIFFLVFLGLAALALIAAIRGLRGAWLLFGVLLAIGLLLPLNHLLRYCLGVKRTLKHFKLEKAGKNRFAYTLAFREDPQALVVRVPGRENLRFPWKDARGLFHYKGAHYLYVEAAKAYMLPAGLDRATVDRALAILKKVLPKDSLRL